MRPRTSLNLYLQYPADRGSANTLSPILGFVPDPQGGNPQMVNVESEMQLWTTNMDLVTPAGLYYCHMYFQRITHPKDAYITTGTTVNYYAPDIGPLIIEWYESTSQLGPRVKKWELETVRLY